MSMGSVVKHTSLRDWAIDPTSADPPAYFKLLGCGAVHLTENGCDLTWRPEDVVLNSAGAVQGGFVTVVIDVVSFLAVSAEDGVRPASIKLETEFFRPILDGKQHEYRCVGAVKHQSRRLVFADVEIRDDVGSLAARGSHLMALVHTATPANPGSAAG